jgi:hypothetical protein
MGSCDPASAQISSRFEFVEQWKRLEKVAVKGASNMENVTSIEGHVLKVDGKLMLLIPLEDGSPELMETAPGTSEICGEFLKIVIPEWLAGVLSIEEGDLVSIHNSNGNFGVGQGSTSRVN